MSGRAHARTHARKASRCTRAPPDSAMHGPPSLSPGAHAPAPTYRLQYSTVISHAWRPIPRAQIMDPRVGSTSAAPHRSWSGGGGGGAGRTLRGQKICQHATRPAVHPTASLAAVVPDAGTSAKNTGCGCTTAAQSGSRRAARAARACATRAWHPPGPRPERCAQCGVRRQRRGRLSAAIALARRRRPVPAAPGAPCQPTCLPP